jgi:PBSX family phage terminase large subunit
MPQSFVDQALARTLTFKDAKIWFNCNPAAPSHWFYKEWIAQQKPKTKRIHFLMDDNPIITEEEKKRAYEMFEGVFFQRYILGQWVAAEGAIYRVFLENKDKFTTNKVPQNKLINIGLDFGGNQSQHALVASAIDLQENKLYVLKAKSYKAEGTSPEDLYGIVADFVADINRSYGRIDGLYADSAEQTLINGLKVRLSIPVRNSIKEPIIDRIRCTTGLMAAGRFMVHEKQCDDLIEAFEQAVYDPKKLDDTRLDDGSFNCDILDAFEYSFSRYLGRLSRG